MMDWQSKINWIIYVIFALLFIYLSHIDFGPFQTFVSTLTFSKNSDKEFNKHVIMFDAGSTGTRIHVFKFGNDCNGFVSVHEECFKVKPGLSNYAHEPHLAASSVLDLLEKAREEIPALSWKETPVVLKATAGLRLLPTEVSNSILKEVSKVITNSPFLSNDSSVSILDGEDEGILAWYTINFLLGRISDEHKSVAALDLGGGSTQVTFLPVELDTLAFSPKGFIINTTISDDNLMLYTHSYLGLGLMSARLSIMKLDQNSQVSDPEKNSTVFFTSCVPPNMETIWVFDQKSYIIKGSDTEKYGFDACYHKAKQFLQNVIHHPSELKQREIYAYSYYYDRALDLKVIGESGGNCSVGEFQVACKNVCSRKTQDAWYLCLDCSYITALFMHGFRFGKHKRIMFSSEINGYQISWALGAALDLL